MTAPTAPPRNAVATVRMREAVGEGASDRVLYGTPDTAFQRQRLHAIACIRRRATPMTALSGGLDDLDLALRRIKDLPAKPEYDA